MDDHLAFSGRRSQKHFVSLLLVGLITASVLVSCSASDDNQDCTKYASIQTPDENKATDLLFAHNYPEAFDSFVKSGQFRDSCIYEATGHTQVMHMAFDAYDTAGEATAIKGEGEKQDAKNLMVSAKLLAAEALKHRDLPAALRRSMRRLVISPVN